jgi:hypothetical protein
MSALYCSNMILISKLDDALLNSAFPNVDTA